MEPQINYTKNPVLLTIKDKILSDAENLITQRTWTSRDEKHGCIGKDLEGDWDGHKIKGSEGDLEMSLDNLWVILSDPQVILTRAKNAGKNMLEMRVVEHVDENSRVFYQLHKPPFPMSKREVVTLFCKKVLSDGRHLYAARSIDHGDCPDNGKNVRAISHIWVWLIEEKGEGKLHCHYAGAFDPMGYVPGVIKNKAEGEHYTKIASIQESYKVLKKNGQI
mmetsp:Transcript_58061/g.66267  ORF Transcript_58061/g.66267 Transcript_58061/m.66267 type:complete len:221 (-) Transcript_58061:40-702(-)